jgi:hypothetical protein
MLEARSHQKPPPVQKKFVGPRAWLDVAALVAEFEAIGEDPEKFKAFVNAKKSAILGRGELS